MGRQRLRCEDIIRRATRSLAEKKTKRGEGYLDRTFEEAGAHCGLSRH